MDGARKRGRTGAGLTTNGGFAGTKRVKELETQQGLASKTKPCTKFFSTAGCPFGEGCHFLHYVPGGYVPGGIRSINPALPLPRNLLAPPSISDTIPAAAAVKTKLCTNYTTAEGCKYGQKCRFAHGEREIGKPIVSSSNDRPMGPSQNTGRTFGRPEPASVGVADSFGASATAKISVDASLAGAIIGKGGVNTKQICRETGVKLVIREHETDKNLKNIELEGTFDQIKHASALVQDLIMSFSAASQPPRRNYP